jgi:DNA polymerase III alpha subunit
MKYDQYGQAHCNSNELFDLLYKNPDLDISKFLVDDPEDYNEAVAHLYSELPKLQRYQFNISTLYDDSISSFDRDQQKRWYMPGNYQNLDIAKWVLEQCDTQEQLQRCGQELLLYQERELFPLLRYLKYLVDTMREHKVLWGVGRGSSVASYVLYKIGIHRIDSMYYDLDISEFLK